MLIFIECLLSMGAYYRYVEGIRKLKRLLKPGGKIVIYILNMATVGGQAIFKIGKEAFHDLSFNAEFRDISMKLFNFKESPLRPNVVGTIFVSATKPI